MSQDQNIVNKISVTIQRGKHDKENPYAQINRAMLRDKSISPKSKGLLCFFLSFRNDYIFYVRKIAEDNGIGKDQVYSILKELLAQGYAYKYVTKDAKGRFTCVRYEFYEEKLPIQERYKEIKEKNTVSGNPDLDNPDLENQTLRRIYSKNNDSKNNITPPIPPQITETPNDKSEAKASSAAKAAVDDFSKSSEKKKKNTEEFSEDVKHVTEKMVDALVRHKPNYIHPKNMTAFMTYVDFLLRIDRRDAALLLDVFSWALCDSFWCDKMYKQNPAEYLRKQFDQLEMRMKAKPAAKPRGFAPCSNDEKSLKKMQEWSKEAL